MLGFLPFNFKSYHARLFNLVIRYIQGHKIKVRKVNYVITSLRGWGSTNQKLGDKKVKGPSLSITYFGQLQY